MKISFTITQDLDLTEFRQASIIGNKIREMTSDLYMDDLMVRVDVSMHDFTGQQLIILRIFDVLPPLPRNEGDIAIKIVQPMKDIRFQHLEVVKELWYRWFPVMPYYASFTSTDAHHTIDTIQRLIRDIQRTNKLKAFL